MVWSKCLSSLQYSLSRQLAPMAQWAPLTDDSLKPEHTFSDTRDNMRAGNTWTRGRHTAYMYRTAILLPIRSHVRLLSSAPSPSSPSRACWSPVIGLELHCQLQTQTKLFSHALNTHQGETNKHVALFDMSIPGTLPVCNRAAVSQAVRTACALHASVPLMSMFERKHYFYVDTPLGYQITQQQRPIAVGGYLDLNPFDVSSHSPASTAQHAEQRRVAITRIQLEMDSGKNMHMTDYTGVDLNRAGIPLVEIVTEPDLRSMAAHMPCMWACSVDADC